MRTSTRSWVASSVCLAGIAFLLAFTGCASSQRKAPEEVIGPNMEPIERVALARMVRATPAEVRAGVGDTVVGKIAKALEQRKVAASLPDDGSPILSIEEDDLKEADPERLRAIGPDTERFVLVVFLTDWSSKITFGSTCTVEVSGYLVDRTTGRVVWHAKGNGKAGQGGLLGMAMKRASDHDAIERAVAGLMTLFPRAVARV